MRFRSSLLLFSLAVPAAAHAQAATDTLSLRGRNVISFGIGLTGAHSPVRGHDAASRGVGSRGEGVHRRRCSERRRGPSRPGWRIARAAGTAVGRTLDRGVGVAVGYRCTGRISDRRRGAVASGPAGVWTTSNGSTRSRSGGGEVAAGARVGGAAAVDRPFWSGPRPGRFARHIPRIIIHSPCRAAH